MKISLLAFAIRFALGFVILMAGFEASRGTAFERFVVEEGVLQPTASVVNALSPGVALNRARRTIASGTARLHVTRGCEGIEMLLLLAAAIIAYPASLRSQRRPLDRPGLHSPGLAGQLGGHAWTAHAAGSHRRHRAVFSALVGGERRGVQWPSSCGLIGG